MRASKNVCCGASFEMCIFSGVISTWTKINYLACPPRSAHIVLFRRVTVPFLFFIISFTVYSFLLAFFLHDVSGSPNGLMEKTNISAYARVLQGALRVAITRRTRINPGIFCVLYCCLVALLEFIVSTCRYYRNQCRQRLSFHLSAYDALIDFLPYFVLAVGRHTM